MPPKLFGRSGGESNYKVRHEIQQCGKGKGKSELEVRSLHD